MNCQVCKKRNVRASICAECAKRNQKAMRIAFRRFEKRAMAIVAGILADESITVIVFKRGGGSEVVTEADERDDEL